MIKSILGRTIRLPEFSSHNDNQTFYDTNEKRSFSAFFGPVQLDGRLSRLLCFFFLYLNRTRPSYVFTALFI